MAERVREQFETEALPRFVGGQRWYAAKGEPAAVVRLVEHVEWTDAGDSWLLGFYEVAAAAGTVRYFLPLSLVWEDAEEQYLRSLGPATIARVRQQSRTGVLADALADEHFARALVRAVGEDRELACTRGAIRFRRTGAFPEGFDTEAPLPLRPPAAAGTNTTVRLGEQLFLKLYRRVHDGVNPEVEVGVFLTEVARFRHSVPVAGVIEYRAGDSEHYTLGLLQQYVDHQGDGWTHTLDYLERFLEEQRGAGEPRAPADDVHGGHLALVQTLAQRTADLHQALATPSGDPAFDPEPVGAHDLSAWGRQVRDDATRTLDLLRERLPRLDAAARNRAELLLDRHRELDRRIDACVPERIDGRKTRYHGDFHLGQVLRVRNDFVIIDFEGEPERPLTERRAKHSALRDVAGMLRSFGYAADVALGRVVKEHADERAAVEAAVRAWETAARNRFVDGYLAALPAGAADPGARRLIALFSIEKALYEIRYELAHRPDWAGVPVRGLLDMLGPPEAPATGDRGSAR
jgi:maltose alpha-D-glucosyltransferase/alpha-amylase